MLSSYLYKYVCFRKTKKTSRPYFNTDRRISVIKLPNPYPKGSSKTLEQMKIVDDIIMFINYLLILINFLKFVLCIYKI